MGKRARVYGFLLLTASLLVGGYFLREHLNSRGSSAQADMAKGPDSTSKGGDEAVPVELVDAIRGEIAAFLSSTANLRAIREVEVAGQSDGVVRRVLAEEGDFVALGQILVQLEDTDLRIQLESARQRISQARLQLEKANHRQEKVETQIRNGREDLQRYEQLFRDGLVSEREMALLKYKVDELEHDERVSSSEIRELNHRVQEIESEIRELELKLSRTEVRAPFNGYVTERRVVVGQAVRNLEALYKLGDFSPLLADVFLPEAEAGQVRPGQPALVSLGTGSSKPVQAKVSRISPVVDQGTGTVKVTVELPRVTQDFRPGAFVRVDIETDTRTDAVIIPRRAVLEEDGERFVYVVQEGTARRTSVRLGYQRTGEIEVLEGVNAGDQVVVAGQGALRDGSKTRLVETG